MAFMEFDKGNYYSRIWFIGGPNDSFDVLMALWRKLPDGPWELKYRFRSKRDDEAFSEADEKSFWSAKFPPGTTEAEAVRKASPVLQKLKAMTCLSVDCTTVESDDPLVIVALMRDKPYFNMKFEETPS